MDEQIRQEILNCWICQAGEDCPSHGWGQYKWAMEDEENAARFQTATPLPKAERTIYTPDNFDFHYFSCGYCGHCPECGYGKQ